MMKDDEMMRNFLTILLICCCGILSAQNYQIGDLYTAPDGSQGIVYYLHPDGSGGWVVALNDASTGCPWGTTTDVPGLTNQNPSYFYINLLIDTAGYANTQSIRSYQNNNTSYAAGLVDFANGWYLPSLAQISMLYAQRPFISDAITAAGGTNLAYDSYWCSDERDANYAWYIRDCGAFEPVNKNTNCRVRAVRSFSYSEEVIPVSFLWSTGDTTSGITVTPTQTTAYSVIVSTPAGCADTVAHTIVVNSPVASTISDTACESYTWNGTTYTESGSYTQTFTAANGCDSVVTLELTIIPPPTLSHTPDTVIIAGTSANLWASGTDVLYWTDSSGNILASGSSLMVSPQTSTLYYLTGQNYSAAVGNNLVVNGDFEQGNVGFTSEYAYSSYAYEGAYYIGYNGRSHYPSFATWFDHTSGSGLYMIVNGAGTPNSNAWTQSVEVEPNTDYAFSAWICNLSPRAVAMGNLQDVSQLQFSVNGTQLGEIFYVPETAGWTSVYEVWNSGNNTTATITVLNQNSEWAGNDFGLDDISFTPLTACSVTDSVYVHVTGFPDNVDSADCTVFSTGHDWGIVQDWASAEMVSPLVIPLVGDIDGDQVPEIICLAPNDNYNYYGATKVMVFNTLTHQLVHTINFPERISTNDAAPYGIIKLPNGHVILVVALVNNTMHAYDLTSMGTTPLWSANTSSHYGPNVSFADFNGDSYPEIVIGNQIYDAETGTLLISNPSVTNSASSFAHHNSTPAGHIPSSLSSPCVANMVGDYRPDLILGNEIYEVLITNRYGLEGNSITLSQSITPPAGVSVDGHPQVADFNLDGHLDVFVSNKSSQYASVGCYVWDVYNNTVSEPLIITTNESGKSIPLIADIDNDDALEIVIQCRATSGEKVKCYKYNAATSSFSFMWDIYVNEDSYSNSMSVFDFNNDGQNDLLISDQTTVRIVNGSGHSHFTGNDTIPVYVLTSLSFGECTVMQYPVVADVDADGSAELVVLGRFGSGHTYKAYLNIFKSAGIPWAPARKVWNQYMYNVTNVNEDLTIPQYLFNNATAFTDPEGVVRRPFNNFLQQGTTIDQYGRPFYAVPDVAVNQTASVQANGDSLLMSFSYCNIGDNTLNAPYTITVFANAYGEDTVCTVTMNESLPVDSCANGKIRVPVSALCAAQAFDSLVIAVNCAGAGIAQNGNLQPECDTTNNTVAVAVSLHSDTTILPVFACDSYTWNGTTYIESGDYVETFHAVNGCDSVVMLQLTIIPLPELSHTPDTVIIAGTSANLWAAGADVLVWMDNGGNILASGPSLTVNPETSTMYYLIGQNQGDCSVTDTIHVIVSGYPDNVMDVDCVFPPDSNAFEMEELYQYSNVNSMSTPMVADMDGDGLPEIIACCYTYSAPWLSTGFHVVNGQTGELKYDISTVQYYNSGQMMTIADVDQDGKAELFLMGRDRKLYCYNYNGGVRWTSANTVDNNYLLSAADVNNDGMAEIVCGKYIYNAQTGALLLEGNMVETGMGFGAPHSVGGSNPAYYMYALGDVDGDGTPELCAGNTAYKMRIINPSGTAGNSWSILRQASLPDNIINKDGQTFIVDFDNDGDFDICVIGITHSLNNYTPSHTLDVYVWDGQTSQLIAYSPLFVNCSFGASIPYSGDLNGDGFPEIIFAVTNLGMLAYTYDTVSSSMSVMHNHAPFGETAGFTVFDFNQDGRNEIVYRGIRQLFIVDGITLENLSAPITAYSGTVTEYPVVADVNADGHAEIIVTRAYCDWEQCWDANGCVSVYGSQIPGAWSSARKVWNQWAYNSVNINEDLTVPQYLFDVSTTFPNGKKPFNGFLQQMPYIDSQGDLFNAVANVVVTDVSSAMRNDSVQISLSYCNTGDNNLFAPYKIAVYKNQYGGELVWIDSVNVTLSVDSCTTRDVMVPFSALCLLGNMDSLAIVINDAGEGVAQNGGQQPECDTTNNTVLVPVHVQLDTTNLLVAACDSYEWFGETITQSGEYTHTLTNTSGCDSVLMLTLTVTPRPELRHTPDTVILTGTSATLWASGADYLYWTDGNDSIISSGNALMVTPESSAVYYLNGQNYSAALDENVVSNGDFELGNAGFSSAYNYSTNLWPAGNYYIGPNAHNYHTGFYNWPDHTTGMGNYMIVNGAESPNTNVWTQTVSVSPNTNYAFSVWVCSVGGNPRIPIEVAQLQFSVNGVQVGDVFTAPNSYGQWGHYYEVWNSGEQTSAIITILNQNTAGGGNDFGIDDISFTPLTECSVTDTIHVIVTGYPDNVDSADCVFFPEGTEWGIGQPLVSSASAITVTTPMVGDIDDDGQQEVVCPAGNSSVVSRINIFNADATLKSYFNTVGFYMWNSVGLAKVKWQENEYKNIIVLLGTNKRLYAYDAQGTQLWQSNVTFGTQYNESTPLPSISFTDFNHDGWTEIYIGADIYDAATGVLLSRASGNKGYSGRTWSTQNNVYHTVVADFFGDCDLELVAGNTIYSVDIQSRTDFNANQMSVVREVPPAAMKMEDNSSIPFTDGNTYLADMNLDGRLDVLVMNVDQSSRVVYLYVWDVETQSIICSKKIANARKFGTPQIGDINQDGYDEVCFITGTYSDHSTGNNDLIYALQFNPQNSNGELDVFWTTSHSDNSACTGLTLFDFNQDGIAELVYRDRFNLRIINGGLIHHQTGEAVTQPYDIAVSPCGSATGIEYPLVVDVDLDGEAEIVVGGSTYETDFGQLYIFNSSGEPWAPARKVWNQYMYNVTNVNEDLTIPQYLFNNAMTFTDPEGVVRRPYNNFLQQATTIDQYGRPFYAVPDVAMEASASSQMQGDDTLALTFSYCNYGDNTLNSPYFITIFADTFGGDTICTYMVNESLPVDSCTRGYLRVPFSALCGFPNIDSLVIAVNCAGSGIAQNGGQQPECDTTNNMVSIAFSLHADTTHVTETACDTFDWYEYVGITQSGDYTHVFTNALGCDSTVIMHLMVIHSTHNVLDTTVCESYTWTEGDGETYTTSGLYTYNYTNDDGCASMDTLHLTILHGTHHVLDTTVCESFTWTEGTGETYTVSDTYTHAYTNSDGCVSMDTLHLTILYGTHNVLDTMVCESFTWTEGTGETYTVSDTYTHAYTNDDGCASMDTLHLTILHGTHHVLDTTVCESFTWTEGTGETYTVSDTYTHAYTNSDGCVSMDTLHLTILHGTHNVLDTTVCESFTWTEGDGETYTTSGMYTYNYTNADGCPSADTLHLTVLYGTHNVYDTTVCESYTWTEGDGETYTSSGVYTYNYTNTAGCASADTLHLIVRPLPVAMINGSHHLCEDSSIVLTSDSAFSYLWNTGETTQSIVVSDEGTYTLVVSDEYGCASDTSYRVSSSYNPILSVNIPDMCAGGSYTISVGYQDDANVQLGNGSTTLSMVDTVFLPDGVPCEPHGCSYRSPLTFSAYGHNEVVESVEDIYYVRLNMEHSWAGDIYINITCPNGQKADLMKYGGNGISACNSTIVNASRGWQAGSNAGVSSYFGQAYDMENSSYICDPNAVGNGQGIGWNYCWSNNTTQGYTYAPGDGSLIYRIENVHNGILDSSNVASGTHFYHPDQSFSSLIGCPLNGSWYIEVVDGWDGDNGYIFSWELALRNEVITDDDAVFTAATSDGPWITNISDSLFRLDPPAGLTQDTTVSYTFHVFDDFGCRYDTTVEVLFYAPRHTLIDTVACAAIVWNGVLYSETGTYHDTLVSSHGCDSIITLNLTINQCYIEQTVDTVICASALPYTWHGHSFMQEGEWIDTLAIDDGLFLVTTYQLSLSNPAVTEMGTNQVACYGGTDGNANVVVTGGVQPYSYQWTNAAGTAVSASAQLASQPAGAYTLYVSDAIGCTATQTVNLTHLSDSMVAGTIPQTQSVCRGNTLPAVTGTVASGGVSSTYQWQISSNGANWNAAPVPNNSQNYNYPNAVTSSFFLRRAWISQTCGTVYSNVMSVSVLPIYADTLQDAVCQGYPYQNNGFDISEAETAASTFIVRTRQLQSSQGCDSSVTLLLTVIIPQHTTITDGICQHSSYQANGFDVAGDQLATAGEYTFEQQYVVNNCDSVVTLHLTVYPEYEVNLQAVICEGDGYNQQGFNVPAAQTVGVGELDLTQVLQSQYACDSVVNLHLTVVDTSIAIVSLTEDFCEEYSADLSVETNATNYVWSTGETAPVITVTQPGVYTVTATQENCSISAWYQIQQCEFNVYLPNAITPGLGDGLNDYFCIHDQYKPMIEDFEIRIYSRWGELVYYSRDKDFKWNGEVNGRINRQIIYTYLITFTDKRGVPYQLTGSITVL